MKNLLIYINPRKGFDNSYNDNRMAEVQIDNSLLFSRPEDILFVTNFPYEYHGVKSLVVGDELFCEADPTFKASKINVIVYLLENKLLNGLTWFHDLDAFQLAPIEVKLKRDLGFCDYGYKAFWNTGSIFFKPSALDVFRLIKNEVYKRKANEEPVLKILTKYNVCNINSRYQKLNNTYNVGMRHIPEVLPICDKPIKVAHFPLHLRETFEEFKPILTQNLIKLINEKYYNDEITPLCEIAFKYGTDKCPQIGHHYTPIYYELLKDRRKSVKKVLELGIGSRDVMQWVPDYYRLGASLLMWRDFFPNAKVYGLDVYPGAMFTDERVETILCDERDRRHLRVIIKTIGNDIDLFVDDGSHREMNQIRTFYTLMPLFKKDVIYIIEDVKRPHEIKSLLKEYDCQVFEFAHKIGNPIYNKWPRCDNLVVIKNK